MQVQNQSIDHGVVLEEGRVDDAQPSTLPNWAKVGWDGLLALAPAAMLCVLLMRTVWDVDIFWQLKLGELILANGGPISEEPFAALHLGEHLPSVGWGAQAIMAWVRQIGGWDLLRVTDALIWLGGFWVIALACRTRGAPLHALILALVLAFCAALPSASIRPQSFACLCFGSLLALQRLEMKPLVKVILGSLLLLVWQNLHPSTSVGTIAMGLAALPGWVQRLRGRKGDLPWVPTILAIVGVLVTFATPDGVSILKTSALNAEMSVAIGASEWLPLWVKGNHINALSVIGVSGITLALILFGKRSVDAGEVMVAVGLLILTVFAYRFVLFWSVAMVPVIARAAGAAISKPKVRLRSLIWPILAASGAMPIAAPTRFAPNIPLPALERLRQEGVKGTVYGDFPFGGSIIDMGYPNWRVAYDGRYYRYSRKEWQYNGGIENGIVPLVDVVRKWKPAAFVLNSKHNVHLAKELAGNWRWRQIWNDDDVVVYTRKFPYGQELHEEKGAENLAGSDPLSY